MNRLAVVLALAASVALLALTAATFTERPRPLRQSNGGGAGAAPAAIAAHTVSRDTAAAERDSLMQAVLRRIAGRENAPAESVFKDIRVFKGMPAGRLVRVMNMGYGKSLGVSCTHCHVPSDWADESKPQKQIARDMAAMSRAITQEMLPKIANLKGKPPTVNCTTCHRGQAVPATNLP